MLVLPLTLLIIAGLAGLQGEVPGPIWDGPLHGEPVAVGVALEIVLGVMLAVTVRRLVPRARTRAVAALPAAASPAAASTAAVKLRWVLAFTLGAGMIAVAATMLVGLHGHVFSGSGQTRPGRAGGAAPASTASGPTWVWRLFLHLHIHLHLGAYLLYGLLVLLFLVAGALRVWWVRRFQASYPTWNYRGIADDSQDPEDMREVVESGRSALRAIDDARAAIIACYLAMEASLADHGAARAIADTPDELLTRATALGIVRGTAGERLTLLFYEARFSSHPLRQWHRDAAEQALAELAAALAEAAAAAALARRSRGEAPGATVITPKSRIGVRQKIASRRARAGRSPGRARTTGPAGAPRR